MEGIMLSLIAFVGRGAKRKHANDDDNDGGGDVKVVVVVVMMVIVLMIVMMLTTTMMVMIMMMTMMMMMVVVVMKEKTTMVNGERGLKRTHLKLWRTMIRTLNRIETKGAEQKGEGGGRTVRGGRGQNSKGREGAEQ